MNLCFRQTGICSLYPVCLKREKRLTRKTIRIVTYIAAKPEIAVYISKIQSLGKSIIPF